MRGIVTQLGEAREELRRIEPRIAVWEGKARFTLAQIGVNIANDLCGSPLVEEIRAMNARVSDAEERAQRRRDLEGERSDVERRLAAADEELGRSESALTALLSKIGAANEEEMERRRADLRQRDALCGALDRCDRVIDSMLADAVRELAGAHPSTEGARLRAALEEGGVDQWGERAEQLESEIAAAEGSLADAIERQDENTQAWLALGDEAEVPALELEQAGLAAELESAVRRWRVLAVGRGLLEEASRELQRTQRRAVLLDASGILATLTGGRYASITFDETGDGLALLGRAGRRVRLNGQVDGDAAAHLGLSIRLAIARHVAQEGMSFPLVVDDLLLAFADGEKEGVAAQIVAFARGQQVLYFTSDRSTWDQLSRLDSGARLIET
jgi:uncharacterized protein YhaN